MNERSKPPHTQRGSPQNLGIMGIGRLGSLSVHPSALDNNKLLVKHLRRRTRTYPAPALVLDALKLYVLPMDLATAAFV